MKKRQFKKQVKKRLKLLSRFNSKLDKKQYTHTLKDWERLIATEKHESHQTNLFIVGKSLPNHVHHPWDNLKVCKKCGNYPFMEGKKGLFETGSPYRILCIHCGRKTEYRNDISLIKKMWNDIN